jgi:hypothetical protein
MANGVTLTAPHSIGSNSIATTGSISSSNNPAAALYSTLVVVGSVNVHDGFSILPSSMTSIGTALVPDSNSVQKIRPKQHHVEGCLCLQRNAHQIFVC